MVFTKVRSIEDKELTFNIKIFHFWQILNTSCEIIRDVFNDPDGIWW